MLTLYSHRHCTIFVGAEDTPFFILVSDLNKCEYLSSRIQADAELGNQVTLPENLDITAKEFQPISDFLASGEFRPRLLSDREVEGVFTAEQKDAATLTVASVHLAATKLHINQLQALCLRKVQSMSLLTPKSLMLLVKCDQMSTMLETGVDGDLRDWLVDCTADRFLDLFDEPNALTMKRLMEEHGEFREEVFERLPRFKEARVRKGG